MTKQAEASPERRQRETPLAAWARLQASLAEELGLTLVTQASASAAISSVNNPNSICQTMWASPEHALLCQADCGAAFHNAARAGEIIEYRCHAGLHCFAVPVRVERRQLVVLGGRAFTSVADYAQFRERYGDLSGIRSGDGLKQARFAESRDVQAAAQRVAAAARTHFEESARVQAADRSAELLEVEVLRVTHRVEQQTRAVTEFYDFLQTVAASLDAQKVYEAVLAKFSDVMGSRRSSLMIVNEQADELGLAAALGPHAALPVRVKLGEGVAGAVLASGAPLVVNDADADPRLPEPRPGRYQAKSFVSFPLTLGPRKVGVLNLTERADDRGYDEDDVALLRLLGPQLALLIDRAEWHKKAEVYQRMSLTDPLTGLPNRRYLEERLFEEVERSKRHGTPLSFMIIDVDRFKSYNDIFGHTNADRVLAQTAQILRRSVRTIDMSARFAGDEFCIVLPETELIAAARIAERLRKAVSMTEYRTEQGDLMGKVTLSIGVSSFGAVRQSPLSIIETADRALYQAKTRGRNCVAVYHDAEPTRTPLIG